MRMPYATAHRQINLLIDKGYCRRVDRRGVMVPVSVLRLASIQADQEAIHWQFVTMVAAMRRLGFALPLSGAGQTAPTVQAVRRIEIDFLLSVLEISLVPADWDLVQLTLFGAILSLSVREVTYDPEASWQYAFADTPPPLARYRPVSVRRLSQTVGVPYETARQCVNRLRERGQVQRVPGGVIISYDWNNSPAQDAMRSSLMGRFVRAMTALARIGVDFSELPVG